MGRKPQLDLFPQPEPGPDEIVAKALSFDPVAVYVGFSGGDDSLATTHWMMNNVPNCRPFSIITGIGIQATIDHRRRVAERYGWDLLEIDAKRDCGQDYEKIVLKHGFPGPTMHFRMYQQLKERGIRKLVRDEKAKLQGRRGWRNAKVLIATGIRHDESLVRMGYAGEEVHFVGSQMWVSPLYWRSKSWFMDYIREHDLPRNPVSITLGMSGECLCGAYAHKGELALVRIVCPKTADYIEGLQARVKAAGHAWGWEEHPPEAPKPPRAEGYMPMCRGCEKTPYMFEEEAA